MRESTPKVVDQTRGYETKSCCDHCGDRNMRESQAGTKVECVILRGDLLVGGFIPSHIHQVIIPCRVYFECLFAGSDRLDGEKRIPGQIRHLIEIGRRLRASNI